VPRPSADCVFCATRPKQKLAGSVHFEHIRLLSNVLKSRPEVGTRFANEAMNPHIIMKKIIAFIILAVSAAGLAAQSAPPSDRPMPNGLGMGLFNKRVDVSTLPEDLQAMINDFRAQRAAFLEQRRAMFEELKNLTEEERKARIEELRAQTREALMAQRELAKNIREELRRLRDERRNDPEG
jgi:hypothetical protein